MQELLEVNGRVPAGGGQHFLGGERGTCRGLLREAMLKIWMLMAFSVEDRSCLECSLIFSLERLEPEYLFRII